MAKLFGKKQQQAPQVDEATKKFNARFAINQEIKKQKKTVNVIANMVQELMKKAWAAKQNGNSVVYKMRLKQINVAEARKKQSEMFVAQTEAMQDMQILNEQSKGIYESIQAMNQAFGVLGLDAESVAKNQMIVEQGMEGLDRQNDLIEQTMDAMTFSLGGTEGLSNEEKELESRIEQMMGLDDDMQSDIEKNMQKIMNDADKLK